MSQILSPEYVHCADEGGVCKITGGKKSVAYVTQDGSGPAFFSEAVRDVVCDTPTLATYNFFKPMGNQNKRQCFIRDVPEYEVANGIPIGFKKCTDEGAECNPLGDKPVDILHGTKPGAIDKGLFTYAGVSRIPCDRIYFNTVDLPDSACYWRDPSTAMPPETSGAPVVLSPGTAPVGPVGPVGPAGPAAPSDAPSDKKSSKTGLYIGIGIGVLILFIIVILIIYFIRKRKRS